MYVLGRMYPLTGLVRSRVLTKSWILLLLLSSCMADDGPECPMHCICSKNLRIVNCKNKNLVDIPKDIPTSATELFLGFNKLTVIKTGSFSTLKNLTNLDLNNNRISELENSSISGLEKLKQLSLTKNKLTVISPFAIQNLTGLERLYLTDNYLTQSPDLSFAPNLIYLTLDTNGLQSADICHGSSWRPSRLSTIILSNNVNISTVSVTDFSCVKRNTVRFIDISRCKIEEVHSDVFAFPHLQSLTLSYNNISYESLEKIFQSVSGTDLASLDLSGVINPKTTSPLPSDIFKSLSNVPLKTFKLRNTQNIDLIPSGTFQYFPTLDYLDLSGSDFQLIEPISSMYNLTYLSLKSNKKLSKIPNITIGTLQQLDFDEDTAITELVNNNFVGLTNLRNLSLKRCNIRTFYSYAFNGLSQLRKLDLSHNRIAGSALPKKISVLQNLEELDLSYNEITILPKSKLFSGLLNLHSLDFSNNGCWNISTQTFQLLENLRTLNLAGNQLGRIIESDTGGELFRNLKKLITLRLDRNQITVMNDNNIFRDLESLHRLNLSHNDLTFWSAIGILNASRQLDIVDLSFNKISTVTEDELLTFPKNTSLNLTSNPFACNCDLIWFRRWIDKNNITAQTKLANLLTYTCNSPKEMQNKRLLDFNPDEIEASCHPLPWKWIVVAVASGLVACMLFVGVVCYKKRYQFRLKWFKLRRWVVKREGGYEALLGGNFQYDIFVSYGPAEHDRCWVKDKLIPRIDARAREEVDGDQLAAAGDEVKVDAVPIGEWNVFYEERDLEFNKPEFSTIAEAIYHSRKVILVLSREYLDDGRRRTEVDAAIDSRIENRFKLNGIILVLLESDADVRVPESLRPILNINGELEWLDDDQSGQELFWNKLSEAIRSEADVMTTDVI